MAKGDTKTEALLNVLGNGGSIDGLTGCCNTKTQNYIIDAIGRIQHAENEIEEMKNNPDVVDIVDTYADLQAYDTSHLGDKDIIRVLQDEYHEGNSTYYRYNKSAGTWSFIGEISSTGGAKILTSADYNANSSDWDDTDPINFNCIALWRLESGVYTGGYESVDAYPIRSTNILLGGYDTPIVMVKKNAAFDERGEVVVLHNPSSSYYYWDIYEDGEFSGNQKITPTVTDSLTSSSTTDALSAKQGKVLNDRISGYVKSGDVPSNLWDPIPAGQNDEPFTHYALLTILDYTFTNNTSVELINNNAVLFAKYGFAIANVDVENQTVTIIAIGQPDSSVNITMIFRD